MENSEEAVAAFYRIVKIAEDTINRIEDEAESGKQGDADMISLLGYMAGISDTILANCPGEPIRNLFMAARNGGHRHAIHRLKVIPTPKENV